MTFTVLGASGFIGRHLVAALRGSGQEVLTPPRGKEIASGRPLGHVLYCIGLTADFRSRPFDTTRAHVGVLSDVLEKAAFDSLLYLSSTRVYARSASGSEDGPVSVDTSDPSDLYNVSKLAGEALCRSAGREHVRVARLSNVVGHDPASHNFVTTLIREALSGAIVLRSDPQSTKDYIVLDDVLKLLPAIAETGEARIYNVASGTNVAHLKIAERLSAITGCTVELGAGGPVLAFPAVDIRRIHGEFSFTPTPVLDVLPELVAQYERSGR